MSYSSVRDYLVKSSQEIVRAAEREGRGLTRDEKEKVEEHLASVKAIDEEAKWVAGDITGMAPESVRKRAADQAANALMEQQVADMLGGPIGVGGTGLANAVLSAGFSLKSHPAVTISSAAAIGAKAVTDSIEAINWAPCAPDLVPMGRDQRFLWQRLPTTNSEGSSSITDFKQTARGVAGSVERARDATTDKAEVTLTLDLVVEELVQWAVVISDIPNAMLEDVSLLRQFLNAEMTYRIGLATDQHVIEQILTAAPGFTADGDGIIETSRNAISDMRANGANPTLLVLDPDDAALLDFSEQPGSGGDYIFTTRDSGSSSPLWNMTVVESPAMAGHNPLLIDPTMLGTLFLGNTRIDADPFTGFKKNLTTLRAEVSGLFHVRKRARRALPRIGFVTGVLDGTGGLG